MTKKLTFPDGFCGVERQQPTNVKVPMMMLMGVV